MSSFHLQIEVIVEARTHLLTYASFFNDEKKTNSTSNNVSFEAIKDLTYQEQVLMAPKNVQLLIMMLKVTVNRPNLGNSNALHEFIHKHTDLEKSISQSSLDEKAKAYLKSQVFAVRHRIILFDHFNFLTPPEFMQHQPMDLKILIMMIKTTIRHPTKENKDALYTFVSQNALEQSISHSSLGESAKDYLLFEIAKIKEWNKPIEMPTPVCSFT